MPWSPVPKMPDILRDLIRRGYGERPITADVLEVSIIKITGLVRARSIKNTIQVMEKLSYIQRKGDYFFILYDPFLEKQKDVSEDAEKEARIEADNLLRKMHDN